MYATPVWQPQVAHQKQNDSDQTLTSLRNRLKALSAHDDNDKVQDKQAPQKNQDHQPPACFKTPKEPKFLDVTTAFFSGPLSHTKSQPQKKAATTPQVPLAHGLIYPAVRKCREQQPRQQQRAQSPPHDFNVLESPVAQDLLQAVAAQSNHLYENGVTKLGELDKSLRDVRAEISSQDDQLLDSVEKSIRRYCKPLSETRILDDCVDNSGVMNRKNVHVSERVAFVKDRVDALEAAIASLWDQWESAQRQVDAGFAELANRDEQSTANKSGSTAAVRASLAREVASFQRELDDILDTAHEEARAFEKHFSKRIHAVQHTLLQEYLLQD